MKNRIARILVVLLVTALSGTARPGMAQAAADITSAEQQVAITDVTITTTDGVPLAGTYYAAESRGPAVLLVHMCLAETDRTSWHAVATGLARAGVHALAIDLRGYGQSAGGEPPFTTMSNFISFWRTTGMNDIEAGLAFLEGQPKVDAGALGFAGASCGVFMGIEAAHRHDNIKALALLSGPFDDDAAAKLSMLDNVPVLGAASEDDGRAYEAMKRVFAATPHPRSRNIQYKGEAHGTNMFRPEPQLQDDIIEWFTGWLGEPPAD